MKSFFKRIGLWLILFTGTDITFIVLAWLIRPEALGSVSLFIILFSILIITIGYFSQLKRQRKIIEAAEKFFNDPNETNKNELLFGCDSDWKDVINDIYEKMHKQIDAVNENQIGLVNYQEYIEAWTHEIKTPLSLMTLVLENHPDEMNSYVANRLGYVLLQINQDVEQILFYARLQADHSDYVYSRFRLDECVQEALLNYAPLAEEKKVQSVLKMQPIEVISDRKVLSFMLSQLISNAVKYAAPDNGEITVSVWRDEDAKIHLTVCDNGNGVAAEDLPFIFDKGFAGNHSGRQKATGMGLYLVSKYATALNVNVVAKTISPDNGGFRVELLFPIVNE